MTVADVRTTGSWCLSRVRAGKESCGAHSRAVGDDVIATLQPQSPTEGIGHSLIAAALGSGIGRKLIEGGRAMAVVFGTDGAMARMRELSGLDSSIIPYALRHSSIVRGLRAGLPIRLVAALHDTSVEMIEKHYSAFIVDAMDELAAKAIVPLTSPPIIIFGLSIRRGITPCGAEGYSTKYSSSTTANSIKVERSVSETSQVAYDRGKATSFANESIKAKT